MQHVVASVPVRVCDVGGWTDTWFASEYAGPGRVCHLAVGPGVRVEARLVPESSGVRLVAPDVGLDGVIAAAPGAGQSLGHPLLEHAVWAVLGDLRDRDERLGEGVEITVRSEVPAGASLGSSAAVVVGVLAALDVLVAGGEREPADLARLAHRVETDLAGRESGVQDQWAAAMGGCALLTINPYPQVEHTPIRVSDDVLAQLGQRLVTVVFGPHDSSAAHQIVIDSLVDRDPLKATALVLLADLARDAAHALATGDLETWGEVLTDATNAQSLLHPSLVGPAPARAIEVARRHGAMGWKVNGAGGAGGSLTVLLSDPSRRDALVMEWVATRNSAPWRVPPLAPAGGVQVSVLA